MPSQQVNTSYAGIRIKPGGVADLRISALTGITNFTVEIIHNKR